ncbi:MAG TPA: carbohydrate-binding protein [Vicinamibacterales bacterium]|nr:carbohydrate-binding protein [Vicinamibacterales bacterium]
MKTSALAALCLTCALGTFQTTVAHAQTADVVLYASDAKNIKGNWSRISDSMGAGGQAMSSTDKGWSSVDRAFANPQHFFEFTFNAPANTPYRIWLRLRATDNSKYNDSVFVQFSNAVSNSGSALYRIGTANALTVNLQSCDGCPLSGWGWLGGAYWLDQQSTVKFANGGSHTMRIQTREDGVRIDQVVLSALPYLTRAPGPVKDDLTIVPKSPAFTGTAATIPGTIKTENFDLGAEGVAYHDLSAANEGGEYRQTGVDLARSDEGGFCIGWISASEWLKYSVNVTTAGSYLLEARVASLGQGGSFHVNFGGTNATGALFVPDTDGWQNWTTISKVVSLNAGAQVMKVVFDTAGASTAVGNLAWIRLSPHTPLGTPTAPAPTAPASTPYSGTAVALPGTIAASDYDKGVDGVAYHDTTAGNSGGQYRSEDVDLETSSLGGIDVGFIADGEWLKYSVNVQAAGAYAVNFKVASPGSQGRLRAAFGNVTTQSVGVPDTGGWQNWTNVSVPITLNAGPQMLTLIFDVGGFNIAEVSVSAGAPVTAAPTPPPPAPAPTPEPDPAPAPSPAPTSSVINVTNGSELQAALDSANPGDTIVLQAGATFWGNFVLPAKGGASYITLRSSTPDAQLPPINTRIDPSYAPLLPKLRSNNTMSALTTAPGAHHYRLQFLEFQANQLGMGDIIALGDGSTAQNSLSQVPHDLVVDRVYVHGDPQSGQKRGIGLNTASTTIVNSYISDIKAAGQDSQAIAGWNGPGPFYITNNYLEAAGENLLFGGADTSIVGLIPSDITITKNYFSKPLAWQSQNWTVKNLFELKNAQHVVVDGNLFENNWAAAQTGYAIVLTPRNQDGTNPWSVVQDVRFTNNVVRNVASGINILGNDDIHPSQQTNNILVRNNLFDDISAARYGGSGRLVLLNGGDNIIFDHNTVFADGSTTLYGEGVITNFVFTNNIIPDNLWGIMGGNSSPGNGTIVMHFPGSQILNNVVIGAPTATYPPNNYYPATIADVRFSSLSTGDYSLSPTSTYHLAANDGSDVGCNMPALNAAMR